MRNIKFRGKRVDNGQWVYGLPSYGSGENIIYIEGWFGDEGGEDYDRIEVDPKTISQFTGLFDKSGTEIHEGDILVNKSGRLCEIIWNEYRSGFDSKPLNALGTNRGFTYNRQWVYCEIIGNIYENPELLNK